MRSIVTNLEYMLIAYVVMERCSRVRQRTPAGSLPVHTGLRFPRHLGLEHSTVTYKRQIKLLYVENTDLQSDYSLCHQLFKTNTTLKSNWRDENACLTYFRSTAPVLPFPVFLL